MTYYNSTDTCDRIKEDGKRCGQPFYGKALKEYDNKGYWTGNWICIQCYQLLKIYGTVDKEIIDNIKHEYRYRKLPYKEGSICPRCGEDGITEENATKDNRLRIGNALKEKDKNLTGRIICISHWAKDYERYDPGSRNNVVKLMRDSRTGNLDPESPKGKGNRDEEIVCELYGYTNLNKRYDNYNTEIDCIDEKTGLLYQVKGRRYNPDHRGWSFGGSFENEWDKEYEDIILICKSEDGETVEEIYRIPFKKEIKKKRKGIDIYKYRTSGLPYNNGWYEKYRLKGSQRDDEINRANNILKRRPE